MATARNRKSHSLTSGYSSVSSVASDGGSTRAPSGDVTPTGSSRRGRSGSKSRAHSVAALVLKSAQAFATIPVLQVSVLASSIDVSVKAVVTAGKVEGSGLPDVVAAGKSANAIWTSNSMTRGHATKGTLKIEGFDPIPFSVAHNEQGATYLLQKGKYRYTALTADHWDWKNNGDKPTEGKAADLEVLGARQCDKAPTIRLQLRPATEMELKRCLQARALAEAGDGEDYDSLHAQITKAKLQFVEQEKIERAEERLRELRRKGRHVSEGCDKESLKAFFDWSKVSRHTGDNTVDEPCTADECCPCNEHVNCGEVLEVAPNAVMECLAKEFGPEGDKELFEELAAAATAVEEGSVWKAGGKFIFSSFDRNQSVSALTRMLNKSGKHRAAQMLLAMVAYSEKRYIGYVTSIQINFHPHGGTYHAQHRDIYSAKQRAGPNCTCSFRKCVGTVCYTVGSSRRCLLETMTDDLSTIKPCGESCQGRKEYVWLNSGDAMFFNEAWNSNHTHGIPAMEVGEDTGPRISIAFLLGAEEERVSLYQIR